jgi:hypothetical protein
MNYKFGDEEIPDGYWMDQNGQLRKKSQKAAERRLMDYERFTKGPRQLTDDENLEKEIYLNDLKEFCENGLAWLIDNNLKIEVREINPPYKEFIIIIENLKSNGSFKNLKWSETKDHFIPFLNLLKRRYSIRRGEVEIIYKLSGKENSYKVDISSLINDRQHIWNDKLCGMKIMIN